VLRAGRIEQVGTPLVLYNDPANQFVAGFIGNPKMNLLKANIVESGPGRALVDVAGYKIDVPRQLVEAHQGPVTFGIRPEHMELGGQGLTLGPAKVQVVEQLGGETLIYAELADGQPLTLQMQGQKRVMPGQTVEASFDPAQCHLFIPEGRSLC
jgi:multiple sugar transport system ATP-binding protein